MKYIKLMVVGTLMAISLFSMTGAMSYAENVVVNGGVIGLFVLGLASFAAFIGLIYRWDLMNRNEIFTATLFAAFIGGMIFYVARS